MVFWYNRHMKQVDFSSMTKEELEKNLGTIAKSGSLDFKTEMEKKEDVDIK